MATVQKYYGRTRASKVYDGDTLPIGQKNKTVSLHLSKKNVTKLVHCLTSFLVDEGAEEIYLTAFKNQKNDEGIAISVTSA